MLRDFGTVLLRDCRIGVAFLLKIPAFIVSVFDYFSVLRPLNHSQKIFLYLARGSTLTFV